MYFWLEILRSPSSVYLSPSRPARKVGSAGLLCPLLACDLYFHWGWSVRQFSLRESLSGGPAKHTKLSCALTIASRGLPRSCASRYPPPFGLRQPLKLYVRSNAQIRLVLSFLRCFQPRNNDNLQRLPVPGIVQCERIIEISRATRATRWHRWPSSCPHFGRTGFRSA